MTSSDKNSPPAASPSSPNLPAPADTNPQPLRTPPLRVAPPASAAGSFPPIPSPTNPGPGSSAGFDPIDHGDSGSTRSSEDGGAVGSFDPKAVKDIARGLVLQTSRYVHHALARTEEEAAEEVWLARGEDQRQIGDPLAKIAQRHGAIDAPPDIVNLIEAGLGALAYLLYHAGKAWTIRRGRRKLAGIDPLTEHQE